MGPLILDARVVIALLDRADERAAELRAAHERLRLPDAMVLATAHELRGPLLSYDKRLQHYAAEGAYE